MLPVPNNNISLNDWVDSLESQQILSLLDLWKGKTNFEDIPELIDYLKTTFKKSGTIKEHYDISIKRENERVIFEKTLLNSESPTKRKRFNYTSNCGRSQCEFRFNGCHHSP